MALEQGNSDSHMAGSQLLHPLHTEASDVEIRCGRDCGLWILKGTSVPSRCGCNFLTGTAFPQVPLNLSTVCNDRVEYDWSLTGVLNNCKELSALSNCVLHA